MNRLLIDIKEDCSGFLTVPVKLAKDPLFTLEALATVIAILSESTGIKPKEICNDLARIIEDQQKPIQ